MAMRCSPDEETISVRVTALVLPLALVALPGVALTGCKLDPTEKEGSAQPSQSADAPATTSASGADAMASRDPGEGEAVRPEIADPDPRPVMQMQVVLERLGFAPGVIDGKEGLSLRNAISAFQQANNLTLSGKPDEATRSALARWSNIPATRVVTIPDDFGAGPFQPVPKEPSDQAKMKQLGYGSLEEKLAERFHTTPEVLRALNPGGVPAGAKGGAPAPAPQPAKQQADKAQPGQPAAPQFRAGQQIRVPNTGADAIDAAGIDDQPWLATLRDLGVGTQQPTVEKVVVSKSRGTLMAYDGKGKLVAAFTATMGSEHDPLPLGEWKIKGVARNPPFHYNPDLFWDADANDEKEKLPPGPNGPVGVVWIDLSKEHYGIHGTPAPETVGRAESHGCVRLTNWDAARLAQMVKPGAVALFEA
jgi:lipoprotein-anchoring transpeptidase ErfK/SrfK